MNKVIVYRNIAMVGGLLLLFNVLFISHQEALASFSKIIDLVVVPLTILIASFWYKKKMTIIGVALYFLSYAHELFVEFDLFSNTNTFNQYRKVFLALGALGLVLVIAAGFERFNNVNNWFFKILKLPEFTLIFTAIISFVFISLLFLLNN